jgi:hypothetical protein
VAVRGVLLELVWKWCVAAHPGVAATAAGLPVGVPRKD